jgi:hypothetical protein
MYNIEQIIRLNPLFRHIPGQEMPRLLKIFKSTTLKKGQLFDIKKNNSLNIIIDGIFEVEASGRSDIVYLSPGSFFGNLPFCDNRHRGSVRALTDSVIAVLDADELVKFFFTFVKSLRGYLRIVEKLGFTLSGFGLDFNMTKSRIISVFSIETSSGKTFLSSALAAALGKNNNTVILDMSYSGDTVFNFFGSKIYPPLSQKETGALDSEKFLSERIVEVGNGISLLNVCHDSKVRVNPDILQAIILILSKKYKYIILDLSNEDEDLRKEAFSISDIIYAVLKKKTALDQYFNIFDRELVYGQGVHYILNEFFSGNSGEIHGQYILPKFEYSRDGDYISALQEISSSEKVAEIAESASRKRKACVFETKFADSLFYAGFLNASQSVGFEFDCCYTSSLSYIVLSLFTASRDSVDFSRLLKKFFPGERINKYLDVSFPDNFVFDISGVKKISEDIFGKSRIEMFKNSPWAMIAENSLENKKIVSTGFIKDAFASSFSLYPVFNEFESDGKRYSCGLPDFRPRPDDLIFTGADEIYHVIVRNAEKLTFTDSRVLKFYRNILSLYELPYEAYSLVSDKNILLEVSERDIKIDRMIILKSFQGAQ